MREPIDELTGMLGEESLALRALELAHQSRRCGEPVALIVGELDALGSGVDGRLSVLLRDVGGLLLGGLRPFDLAYRVGEQRFLVLLPGADHERGAETAERLRHNIEAAGLDAGGNRVTMSFGVGASREGWSFHLESVLREAEQALGRAKARGNGVCAGER
jgi:diguanylate cyclase (GGDEF)-like protein